MGEWTSRERALAAISRKEPDRIPICFGIGPANILECPPDGRNYTRLCQYLGIQDYEEPVIAPWANTVCNVDERIMDMFGSDFREITPNPPEVRTEPELSESCFATFCCFRS